MSKPTLKTRTPGGMIYVHFHDAQGKLQRKSCDTRDMRIARQRIADIVAGGWTAPTAVEKAAGAKAKAREVKADSVTMAHLLDRCAKTIWSPTRVRSQPTVRSQIRILNRLIGAELVADMTYKRLEALADQLRAEGYAEATVDRKLSAVGAALSQACKETDNQGRPWITGKPAMPTFAADNFCDRTVSLDEETTIFEIIAARATREPMRDWTRFGHLIRFLFDTGCRKGDALSVMESHLSTRQIDGLIYTFVTFYNAKGRVGSGKHRTIPLTQEIVASLSYLKAASPDGRLFPFRAGGVNYFWSAVRKDARDVHGIDLSDVKIHTLRHTNISRKAAKSGKKGDIHKISQWAGHSNIAITVKRYAHLMPEDMIDLL